MDRRRFLKYAAAGVTVGGAALAGYEFSRYQTALIPPSASTVTRTLNTSGTVTETVRLASLHGRLFFDYNGNGVQDREEPAVSGALVQLSDGAANVVAEGMTDSSGDYELEDVRTGSYRLHVEADKRFRYMCTSAEEVTELARGYKVTLNGSSNQMNIGLMEGFLTLPFPRDSVRGQWDRKNAEGYYTTFVDIAFPSSPPTDWRGGHATYEHHDGTDFILDLDTPLIAPAPGVVIHARDNYQDDGYYAISGKRIVVDHLNGYRTAQVHLNKLNFEEIYGNTFYQTGQPNPYDPKLPRVARGQLLGWAGKTGKTEVVHDHFEVNEYPPAGNEWGWGKGTKVDVFRDIHHKDHLSWPRSSARSFWTVDNNPQFT